MIICCREGASLKDNRLMTKRSRTWARGERRQGGKMQGPISAREKCMPKVARHKGEVGGAREGGESESGQSAAGSLAKAFANRP